VLALSNLLHLGCSFDKVQLQIGDSLETLYSHTILQPASYSDARCYCTVCGLWTRKEQLLIQFSQQISVSGKKVHQTSLHTSPGVRLHLVGLVLRFQNPRRGYSLFSVFCYGLQSIIHHLLKGLRRNCKGESSKHMAKDTLHVAASGWHSSTLCLHTSARFFFLPQVWLLPSCLKFSSVKQN
jgi:hypothetical protein